MCGLFASTDCKSQISTCNQTFLNDCKSHTCILQLLYKLCNVNVNKTGSKEDSSWIIFSMHGNFHTINSCVIKKRKVWWLILLQVRAMHEQQTGLSTGLVHVDLNRPWLCSCGNCSSWARSSIVSMCGYPHLSITFYAYYDLLACQAHRRVMQYSHSLSRPGSPQFQALVLLLPVGGLQ